MNLAVMTIPDDPAALPRWLDEQLVGDRLGDVVAELAAVHGSVSIQRSIRDFLGAALPNVLERGIGALPPTEVTQLMRLPHHLVELQELVFVEGGAYWDGVPRPASLHRAVGEQWDRIAGQAPPIVPLTLTRARRRASPWLVSFATAAAVLLAVIVYDRGRQPQDVQVAAVGWGWAKPEGLPHNPDAKGYYEALAQAGGEWKQKQPDDAAGLARRINEFRQGCSTLILAEHKPLPADRKKELIERCRKWAAKLDDALAKLEAGGDPVAIRSDVDSVVDGLVKYLNAEAAKA